MNSVPFLRNKISQLIDLGGYFPRCNEHRGIVPVKSMASLKNCDP